MSSRVNPYQVATSLRPDEIEAPKRYRGSVCGVRITIVQIHIDKKLAVGVLAFKQAQLKG